MPFPSNDPTHTTGWIINPGYEPEDSANELEGMTWQFRISVLPTQDNLLKALNALRNVSQLQGEDKTHPTAKIVAPMTPDDLDTWDGVIADASDRDQRGKEICVYMPYDEKNGRFAFDGEYLKTLMLDMWKALVEEGVVVSYITPPNDEKTLPTDPCILTPFCYSAFKNFRNPDGILSADGYNPMGHPDPLQGVYISYADLESLGLDKRDYHQDYVFHHVRHRYHEQYLKDLEGELEIQSSFMKELDSRYSNGVIAFGKKTLSYQANDEVRIGMNKDTYYHLREYLTKDLLNELKTQANNIIEVPELLASLDENMDALSEYLPTNFNNGRRVSILDQRELQHYRLQPPEEQQTYLQRICDQLIQAQDELEELLTDVFGKMIIDPRLSQLASYATMYAKTSPYTAQSLYRQCLHLKNQIEAYREAEENLLSSTFEMAIDRNAETKYPKSYEKLWSKQDGLLLDKARNVLNDYTKSDSKAKRAVTGHWRRHYITQISNIVKKIDDAQIEDLNQLADSLNKIDITNEKGSLAKRVRFIKDQINREVEAFEGAYANEQEQRPLSLSDF